MMSGLRDKTADPEHGDLDIINGEVVRGNKLAKAFKGVTLSVIGSTMHHVVPLQARTDQISIWGTGAIRPSMCGKPSKKVKVHATRGMMSRGCLKRATLTQSEGTGRVLHSSTIQLNSSRF